jgi:hypothetical protein
MLIQPTLATGLALFGNRRSQHPTVWLKQLRRRRRPHLRPGHSAARAFDTFVHSCVNAAHHVSRDNL